MERPVRSTNRDMKSGLVIRSKQESGGMSHHEACETSATAACRVRLQHENQKRHGRSYSCYNCTPPSPRLTNSLRTLLSLVVLVVTWTSLFGAAFAQGTYDRRRSTYQPAVPVEDLTPTWKGQSILIIDTRPPPIAPLMHLNRRKDGATPTTSAASSKTSTGINTDPSATSSGFSIPKPFDTALSNNFTATCAVYFRTLLNNDSFQQCHPFSLMLQTSSGFFDASKSFVRITQTLEATCNANVTQCKGTMGGLARELISSANCGTDYQNNNPQVLQAFNGLVAYEPLYQASCLRDAEGSFCYANAVTNTSATTDSYPFYLPLGVQLPGGARPTCNHCLQNEMAIFSSFASNSTQPVSKTYNSAAAQVQIACGNNFVNQTATPLKGSASATTAPFTPIISLLIMVLLWLS